MAGAGSSEMGGIARESGFGYVRWFAGLGWRVRPFPHWGPRCVKISPHQIVMIKVVIVGSIGRVVLSALEDLRRRDS